MHEAGDVVDGCAVDGGAAERRRRELLRDLARGHGLLDGLPDVAEHDVYLCGADGWMTAARTAALDAGVPAASIHLERFSW